MPMRRRQTLVSSRNGFHKLVDLTSGVTLSSSTTVHSFSNFQQTFSEGHPWLRSANWKKMNIAAHLISDMGGPFETRSLECIPGGIPLELSRITGGYLRAYSGEMFAYYNQYSGQLNHIQEPSSDAVLDGLGATAIANTIPTNPLSGIGQFAAELRELPTTSKVAQWVGQAAELKSIRRMSKTQLLRRSGSDYLNFQFGWLPFVKDLKDFFKTARDADKHINQLVRDSGRGVRRRWNFPDEVTTVVTDMGNGYGAPSLDSYLIVGPGKLTKTVITRKRRWFSGSFTYYLPKDVNARNEAILHHLYGLRLDADLIWKIAPWTWALDWKLNFGDVVRNVAAFAHDGLVMRYGYMMERTSIITEYALDGLNLYGIGPINLTQSFVTTTKKRRKATPYGFGFDLGSLNARQRSIIVALGLTRGPR